LRQDEKGPLRQNSKNGKERAFERLQAAGGFFILPRDKSGQTVFEAGFLLFIKKKAEMVRALTACTAGTTRPL
jgi:hypothetical protein